MNNIISTSPGVKIYSLNWWERGKRKGRAYRRLRAKEEREAGKIFAINIRNTYDIKPPYIITLIRYYAYPDQEYDEDNFIGGCKHFRDGFAKGLGYNNDNHLDLYWKYMQKKCKKEDAGLVITVKTRERE